MNQIEHTMLALLRCELTGQTASQAVSQEDIGQLYHLTKKHELVHLAANALEKHGALVGSPYLQQFEAQLFDAHYRTASYQYTFERLCQLFEQEKICYLPLKGLVLRSFYPEAWMRLGCDIDLLIHEEDLDRACSLLQRQLGYTKKTESNHDIAFLSADGVCVELHYDLVEEKRAASSSEILAHVWAYSHPEVPGQFRYAMEDRLFYVYHIAHMAKHFERGGCGMRSVLDLWLMERQHRFWTEDTRQLLQQTGLLTFANSVRRLAAVWFEGEPADPFMRQLSAYIIRGGIYGSVENQYAVSQYRTGGKLQYIWSKLFLPFGELKLRYPILRKHPWLFPVLQVVRWVSLLTGTKTQTRKDALRRIRQTTNEQVSNVADLLNRLEL